MKFRVWDEKHRCWDTSYQQFYPGEEMHKQGRIIQFAINLKETYPNGKDIYDGDIVIGRDLNERSKVTAVVSLDIPWGVFYVKPSDYFSFIKDGKYFDAKLYSLAQECDFKIIGNIFENPELLKII
jgi:hypothetical protein